MCPLTLCFQPPVRKPAFAFTFQARGLHDVLITTSKKNLGRKFQAEPVPEPLASTSRAVALAWHM